MHSMITRLFRPGRDNVRWLGWVAVIGLVLVALKPRAYDALREAFATRKVRKFYWAVAGRAPRKPSGLRGNSAQEKPNCRAGWRSGKRWVRRCRCRGERPARAPAFRTLPHERGASAYIATNTDGYSFQTVRYSGLVLP